MTARFIGSIGNPPAGTGIAGAAAAGAAGGATGGISLLMDAPAPAPLGAADEKGLLRPGVTTGAGGAALAAAAWSAMIATVPCSATSPSIASVIFFADSTAGLGASGGGG